MLEHTTMLRPEARPADMPNLGSGLPSDLLGQVRGRVRLLASLLFVAFCLDPLIWLLGRMFGEAPGASNERLPFAIVNVCALLPTAGLWWTARSRRVSANTLLNLALVYEVLVCFVVSILTFWQFYLDTGAVANMTWVVGIVVLFPLIIPGPPRRIVAGAITSACTSPLALLILEQTGKVTGPPGEYVEVFVPPLFAAGFAYFGARVVYGLGRQIVEARDLGSYRLESLIGTGGMGEVWRARHRMLARPAAIKLIRPRSADGTTPSLIPPEFVRRFELEAQAIASLRSPHTVNLFDYGVSGDGSFYYVMELLDGMDADGMVRRFGPMSPPRVVHILRQVCHSLSEAESRGLVHRDIKPANIYLCRYGEDYDFVKVLDFGLVKTVDGSASRDRPPKQDHLTGEHVVHGTPAFMAPEQAMGHADLDSRVDIYSTGCVAYWLLTGHTPFEGESAMALLVHHINTPPTPPSARSPGIVPPDLDALVLSCLAKNPSDRPASAKELSRRLSRIDIEPWTESDAEAWWRSTQRVGEIP